MLTFNSHMSLFYHPPGLQCPKVPLKLRISWDLEPDVTGKPESLHNLQVEPDLQQTGEVFPNIELSINSGSYYMFKL